ncbi:hypothetical protein ADUPG1_006109 [Aduncisulcus paluster]|uniref:Uncharacterized protein n=1 Tax=Aduncisulcus paluster TaxID=2918883 RepID=A0ABQ5KGV8_9EUKA|nr:hypothetical protein ADUPG1_006109 [Aduncisulcus paluster]
MSNSDQLEIDVDSSETKLRCPTPSTILSDFFMAPKSFDLKGASYIQHERGKSTDIDILSNRHLECASKSCPAESTPTLPPEYDKYPEWAKLFYQNGCDITSEKFSQVPPISTNSVGVRNNFRSKNPFTSQMKSLTKPHSSNSSLYLKSGCKVQDTPILFAVRSKHLPPSPTIDTLTSDFSRLSPLSPSLCPTSHSPLVGNLYPDLSQSDSGVDMISSKSKHQSHQIMVLEQPISQSHASELIREIGGTSGGKRRSAPKLQKPPTRKELNEHALQKKHSSSGGYVPRGLVLEKEWKAIASSSTNPSSAMQSSSYTSTPKPLSNSQIVDKKPPKLSNTLSTNFSSSPKSNGKSDGSLGREVSNDDVAKGRATGIKHSARLKDKSVAYLYDDDETMYGGIDSPDDVVVKRSKKPADDEDSLGSSGMDWRRLYEEYSGKGAHFVRYHKSVRSHPGPSKALLQCSCVHSIEQIDYPILFLLYVSHKFIPWARGSAPLSAILLKRGCCLRCCRQSTKIWGNVQRGIPGETAKPNVQVRLWLESGLTTREIFLKHVIPSHPVREVREMLTFAVEELGKQKGRNPVTRLKDYFIHFDVPLKSIDGGLYLKFMIKLAYANLPRKKNKFMEYVQSGTLEMKRNVFGSF